MAENLIPTFVVTTPEQGPKAGAVAASIAIQSVPLSSDVAPVIILNHKLWPMACVGIMDSASARATAQDLICAADMCDKMNASPKTSAVN